MTYIIVFIALIILAPLSVFVFLRLFSKEKINNGAPGIATVLRCDAANFTLSNGKESKSFILKIEASITNENGETWPVKMVEHVPDFQVAQFYEGTKFRVIYSKSNRNKAKVLRNSIDGNTVELVT